MPDVKISALPASTTPLAGTEVLPIVQSATTRQVSVANLTAGRAVNALSLTASSLTSGRVTYAGASGLLTDSATLQFNANGLGIGAAPNTSPGSPYFNLNVGGGGGGGIISSGDDTYFTSNLYITGGANYFAVTGPAYGSYYNQSNGNHLWLSSTASGAGGTVATVTEKMRLTSAGDVGIGTSSPASKLHVSTSSGGVQVRATSDSDVSFFALSTGADSTALVAMANDARQWTLRINGAESDQFQIRDSTAGANRLVLDSSGNVQGASTTGMFRLANSARSALLPTYAFVNAADVGMYNPADSTLGFVTGQIERMRIDSSGIVTMSAYGAGAATFSASGVISSVSDETWKTKDGVPVNTDVMLQKLEPGYWFYNEEKAPIYGQDRQLGFYAQNVHEAIGAEAAPTPEEGKPWGYYDRSVLAVAVMSLKNALTTIEELKQRITALENK